MPVTPKKKSSLIAAPVKQEAIGANTTERHTNSPNGAGWSNAQKGALFEHVCKVGETAWEDAVPGKTAKQSREQWKKTLYPALKRQNGW